VLSEDRVVKKAHGSLTKLDGIVNKQNIPFWATEYPHQIQEKERDNSAIKFLDVLPYQATA
jgi:hypothetical protein